MGCFGRRTAAAGDRADRRGRAGVLALPAHGDRGRSLELLDPDTGRRVVVARPPAEARMLLLPGAVAWTA